jgi:mRNA-degrading endonuclease RelE of RelBE toxin-antitoxin system
LPFRIDYSPEVKDHLRSLTARQRSTVFGAIKTQLVDQPTVVTRNRKPMRPNPLAEWELRLGSLRVYYEVNEDSEPFVLICAVGVKRGNRVWLADEEVDFS